MDYFEKTLSSQRIFEGRIINLRVDEVLLQDGAVGSREIVEHNGGVGIVAVNKEGIILVNQFRKPIDNMLLEIPAGKIEKGEVPDICAARELEEETGFIPIKLKLLSAIYTSPGFSSEKLYIYLSTELKKGTINRDKDEFMDVAFYKTDDILNMIKSGIINDAKTICGILMYLQHI